jgi:hypothetical protein
MNFLIKVGLGLGAGVAASIVAGLALDNFMATSSDTTKKLVLGGLAVASAMLIGPAQPALAAGVATGLLIVPAQQVIGHLMAPTPAAAAAASTPTTGMLIGGPAIGMLNSGTSGLGDMRTTGQDASDDALLSQLGLV